MPLRIDQILATLKAALEAFAQGLSGGGTVSIATDPFNVFELLSANSRQYILGLLWAGDENISEVNVIPLLLHRIEIVFGSSLGLTATPDQRLIAGNVNRPAIYQSLDDLRTLLLNLQFSSEQTGAYLEYQRTEPVITPEGVSLAAFKLVFGLRAVPGQSKVATSI